MYLDAAIIRRWSAGIAVRDRKDGTTTLVSVGLVVAWESQATNLTADTAPEGTRQVFVRVTLAPAPTPSPPIVAVTGGGSSDSGSALLLLGFAIGLLTLARRCSACGGDAGNHNRKKQTWTGPG